jgi:paraquat-inducible protein B
LLLFSSSKMFTKTREIIVYFDDSLNGLNEGAPVKYRGVTIGTVKRLMVNFNQPTNDYAMPVILEIQDELIKSRRVGDLPELFSSELEMRIDRGVRASLQTESLVTGVLYVDIRPSPTPPAVFHQTKPVYPELATEPTQIQQLFNNLARVDVKALETNINALIIKLDNTIGQLQMGQISGGITNLLGSINRLVDSSDLTNSLAAIRPTLDQYRLLAEKLGGRIDPLADSLTNSLAEASLALAEIRGTAGGLRSMLAPDAAFRSDLDQLMQELSAAGHSLSSLLEFLKQHPNAIITGRK